MKIQDILQLPDLDGLRIAYKIAQEAHKDQKRWGGEPYMTHIDAVIENTFALQTYPGDLKRKDQRRVRDAFLIVAALHDVIEDASDKFSIQDIEDQLAGVFKSSSIYATVISAILAITKLEGEEYLDYLQRVKYSAIAITVKRADLQHNMSDLAKYKKKDKLDKYKLAYYFLEH